MWFWAFNVYFNAPECVLCQRDPELIPGVYLPEIHTVVFTCVGLSGSGKCFQSGLRKTGRIGELRYTLLIANYVFLLNSQAYLYIGTGIFSYDHLLRSSRYKICECLNYADTMKLVRFCSQLRR